MNALTEKIEAAGLQNRVFTDRQLADIVGGGDARRYGLVNRAIKDGTLLRLKRGLYLLSTPQVYGNIHPFAIAQALRPGSYVSFETALAFHQWIPEAVFTTASVTPARKSLDTQHELLGHFPFHPLAVQKYHFLTAVTRVKLGQRTALVARPLRALMDLVALRKERWSGMEWIGKGLRIDETQLAGLCRKYFYALSDVYKHKAAREFLTCFERELIDHKFTIATGQHRISGSNSWLISFRKSFARTQ